MEILACSIQPISNENRLLKAFLEFYKQIHVSQLADEEKGRKVMVFDSTKIRRELFKSYSKDYALNQTADATSVFHLLQTMLHECQEMTFGKPCKHEMAKTPCAMHSRFFINHIQTQVC